MVERQATPVMDAPAPPKRFRGSFLSDPDSLDRMGRASGPFRRAPRAVAVPADAEDVADLVTWAVTEGVILVPRGAGTGMPGGNVGHGVVVDLAGMTEVTVVDPEEGTIEAGPGATGASLERAAASRSRFFPALPSSADRCTVGGMVANNAAGARTFGYGPVHAWVDEVEMVMADGTLGRFRTGALDPRFDRLRSAVTETLGAHAPAWPAVRKNASGYALDRFLPQGDPLQLLVGSEGTLGILTRVRLRTAPRPEARAVVLLPLPDVEALDAAVAEVEALGAAACEFFGTRFLDISGLRADSEVGPLVTDHPALVLVEVDGTAAEVAEALARLAVLASALGVPSRTGRSAEEQERIWHVRHAASPVVAARADQGLVSMQFIEDSVVPRGHLAGYLYGLSTILHDEETDAVVFGHAGDGNVHVNPLVDVRRSDWRERVSRILERTVDLVAALGGTLSGEHGDGRLRAPFHARVFGSSWSRAFHHVKDELDPTGVFNPGVIVALAGQNPLEGLSSERRVG